MIAEKSPAPIRCAIYTRKSSDEGLEQDFNSLDAQRDGAEAFITSQREEGWVCLPQRYDDGGFSGGNLERPAMRRLIADIEAGRIDCVVVYKVDRLSRSLMDFVRMMETFDKHNVSFVSVTQSFNTTHSMGRLTLNILLSFAQFEREIISERTRDKIAAARKRGKWAGGHPILGYDLVRSPGGSRLVVNEEEAKQVRRIFEIYLERRSLRDAAADINDLGLTTKVWTTSKGSRRGGKRLDKTRVYKLLTNVAYRGLVRYRDQVFPGEHEAIVDEDVFRRVQAALRHNGRSGGTYARNKHGALLKGIVRCKACGCAMGHHFASRGQKRYRYYVCMKAQKQGWANCPGPSLPAFDLEQFVIEQIGALANEGDLPVAAVRRAQEKLAEQLENDRAERRALESEINALKQQIASGCPSSNGHNVPSQHVESLRHRLGDCESRARVLDDTIGRADRRLIDEDELVGAVESFTPLWESLSLGEQQRIVSLIIRQVEYDFETESVSIAFHDGVLTDETTAEASE